MFTAMKSQSFLMYERKITHHSTFKKIVTDIEEENDIV